MQKGNIVWENHCGSSIPATNLI